MTVDIRMLMTCEGHWAHQDSERYYNGLTHEEISGPNRNLRNGIQGEYSL